MNASPRSSRTKTVGWRVTNPRIRQSYRLNVGTIVEEPMLKVKLVRSRSKGSGSTGAIARGGRMLGQIEEYFIEGLVPNDTFVFGGEVVRYEALMEDEVYVSRTNDANAKVPSYMAVSFRSRHISLIACGIFWPTSAHGKVYPTRCRTGSHCRRRFRACPIRASWWSKHFRARINSISCVTRSRAV